tara:strand:+ start:203 stop:424 length:222 start_codon:yes stop_codon:yes gene_type:complete
MLDPNNPDDILSIEKSRNIVKEILDFGTNENEKLKIIELLCLELENTGIMKEIISVIKAKKDIKSEDTQNLIL